MQDDPCNVLKSTDLGVTSLMENLLVGDDRSWFYRDTEPWQIHTLCCELIGVKMVLMVMM